MSSHPPPSIRIPCQWLIRLAACWLVLIPAVSDAASREPLRGKVVKVFDGDSFVMRARAGDIEVRLADVDAPEKGQPYADNARLALTALLQGWEVSVEVVDIDAYRRSVGRVRRNAGDLDINAEVVRRGHAWVYRRYVRDQTLFALEDAARRKRAGLWGLPEDLRVAPWTYRQLGRAQREANARSESR